MTPRSKPYLWAIAGMLPITVIATAVTDRVAGFVLIVGAMVWNQYAAALAERHANAPTVAWRERRILHLEGKLRDAEHRADVYADTAVVDLRFQGGQGSELARRVEAARDRERLHAEPTAAELTHAKTAMVDAFAPIDLWRD